MVDVVPVAQQCAMSDNNLKTRFVDNKSVSPGKEAPEGMGEPSPAYIWGGSSSNTFWIPENRNIPIY